MLGGISMNTTVSEIRDSELLSELDKGIDDMENGHVTPHEESMNTIMQQYNDYVLQNS